MDWVHCNKCFYQPGQPARGLLLTSCGHVLCTNCTAGAAEVSTCLLCKTSCSCVRLTKQLPSEVEVYFTEPDALIDKFVGQFTRVVRFQREQSDRLLQHKIATVQRRLQQTQAAMDQLTRENNAMKTQLAQSPSPAASRTPQPAPSGGWAKPTTPFSRRAVTPDAVRKHQVTGAGGGGPARMCVRTPPLNGRMGVIPSSRDHSVLKGVSRAVRRESQSPRTVRRESQSPRTPQMSPVAAAATSSGRITPRHHVVARHQATLSEPQRGWSPAAHQRAMSGGRMISPRLTSPMYYTHHHQIHGVH